MCSRPTLFQRDAMSLATLFQEDRFPYLAYRIGDGDYVTKAELKRAKAAHEGEPVPEIIRHYEERLRRGEIKRPGRPAGGYWHHGMCCLVRLRYPKILRYLQICRRRGADPWKILKTKDRYSGPPHEIAAKVMREWYLPHCDWRHVLNIAKGNW
jgi:hypothetical protein